MIKIRSPQDLGAAALLMLLGVVGLWFGQEYSMGTVARMGPGYMPRVLSGGLVLFALWIGGRAFIMDGPPIEAMRFRPIALVVLSIIAFALMIRPFGLMPTTFLVVLLCGFATSDVRWKEAFILAAVLAVFVVLVFVYGLNQTISIFGEWW